MAYTQQQSMIKPDSKPKKLPYSCEEIYERMDKGLCIFCEELDTPGHNDLKHKGIQIFMVECDDDRSDDVEEVHQIQKAVKNPDPFVETVKNSDPLIDSLKRASVLQVPDFGTDVLIVHKMDSHVKDVEEFTQQSTNDNGKNIALQVFDEMPLRVTSKEKQGKSLKAWRFKFKPISKRSKLMDDMFSFVEETAWLNKDPKETIWDCIKKEFKETMAACGKKTIDRLKLVDETSKPAVYDGPIQIRVWESGGSPLERVYEESSGDVKFHLKHKWRSRLLQTFSGLEFFLLPAKLDLRDWQSKSYQGSHQSFDRKKSNKTLYLEDGHEAKEVTKFISTWNNRVWEPGGVLIEHDKWKGLENCYVRDRGLKYYFLLEMPFAEFIEIKACRKELSVASLSQLSLASDGKSNEEAVTVLAARPQLFNTFLRNCEYNKVDNPWVCNDRQKGAVCDAENKKLLNIEAGAKKGTNSCLGGKIAVAWSRENGMVSKVGGSTFDLECDQIKFNNKEEFVDLTESGELQPSREYLLMNFGIFMNPQPLHDKRITRALLVGLVGTEEKLSNSLSLANYVWKPGELLCVQDQWDWISEVHSSGGGVLKITQQLRGMHLQGFVNMDKRLQKLLLDDVLRVMVCWSVHNRICEVERKIYISANQNSRNQELPTTYRFLMIGKFSRSKRLNETCCFLLEMYFEEFVGCNAHENETQSTNQSHGMEGSTRDIQGLENGYKRIVLKLKLPLSSGADWEQLLKWVDIHFSDNQRQEGLLSFPWELMLANLKENHACGVATRCLEPDRYEFIWWVSRTCEADHISSETFSVGAVHGFFTGSKLQTGDETQEKRLLFLNNNNKVDHTVKANWFHNEPIIREVFHLQRPPELIDLQGNPNFITKVLFQWKEHPPDQFFSGFYGQVLMLSSLRTRMF